MSTTRRYTFRPADQGASIGHGPNRDLTGRYGQAVSLTDRAAYLTIQSYPGESGVCLVADVGEAAEQAASQAILDAIAGGETYAAEAPLSNDELAAVRAMDSADVEDLTDSDVSVIQASNLAPGDMLAKVADVPTALTDLSDTPGGLGTAGQVLKVNGTADGLEFGDAGGAAEYVRDPSDWISMDGVVGFGADTGLTTAAFPDLDDLDAVLALASLVQFGSAGLRLRAVANNTTPQGIDLGTIAADADGCIAVRLRPFMDGADHSASRSWGLGLAVWDGVDTGVDDNVWVGIGGTTTSPGDGTFNRNSTAGRGTGVPSVQTYGIHKGARELDVCITRDGGTGAVTWYIGTGGSWTRIWRDATHTADAGAGDSVACKVGLMLRSLTAGLTVGCDVTHIGVFAQATPPLPL